jgi:hypothetical protein
MALSATLKRDPSNGFPYELTRTPTGFQGVRSYLVNTGDLTRIFTEPVVGLPLYGEAWDPALPDLKVRSITPRYIGGRADANGEYNWTAVVCAYQTPGVSILDYPLKPGDVISQLASEDLTQRVRYPVDDAGDPDFATLIDNGDGYDIDVGLNTITIRKGLTKAQFQALDFGRLYRLNRKKPLNLDGVIVPNINGIDMTLSFNAKQLRYKGWTSQAVSADSVVMEHTVLAAPDHDAVWIDRDAVGAGDVKVAAQVYPAESFAGLW